jgi:hypothetical protein
MESLVLIRTAAWLLAAAVAAGAVMATYRLAWDRRAPTPVARLHGGLAGAGLCLLVYGWATAPLSKAAILATVLLLVAATGGLTIAHARHWKRAPSIETLVFVHLSLAASGYIVLLAASLAPP